MADDFGRSAIEQRSGLCTCNNPGRRIGAHSPDCAYHRPVVAWTDAELAAEADRVEARIVLGCRTANRAARRARRAAAYNFTCVVDANEAWRRLDELKWLRSAIRREMALRANAPMAGEGR